MKPLALVLLASCASAPVTGQRASNVEASVRVWLQTQLDAASEGGTVVVPAGRWLLDRAPAGSYNRFACLSTHGHDLTIRGVGPESVLVLEGDQGAASVAVLSVDPGARHIRIADLTIDTTGATNTDEQTIAIATSGVCSGLTCQPITDLSIEHVAFRHPRNTTTRKGDCVKLLGNTEATRLSGVRIVGNDFADCARSAVMIQRGVSDVVLSGNTFNAFKTCVDGEATGTEIDERIAITGNVFRPGCSPALSLTSTSGAVVSGNSIAGAVTVYRSTDVDISGNRIAHVAVDNAATIDVANVCDGLTIGTNTVRRSGVAGPVVKLVPHSGGICGGVVIGQNRLTQLTSAGGIHLESVSGVAIAGNQMRFLGAPAFSAIYERSVLSDPVTGVLIASNQVSGVVGYGVQLHAYPGQFGAGVVVRDSGTVYQNNPAGFLVAVER